MMANKPRDIRMTAMPLILLFFWTATPKGSLWLSTSGIMFMKTSVASSNSSIYVGYD